MTDQTVEPIRESNLPCTPPPKWEFHTWFPHPDGGGDMVRGERQRGVLVRRRVSYSDWEPVRPDRWADEPETAAASAAVVPAADRAALVAEAVAELEALRDTTDVNVAVYPRYDARQKSALNDGIARLRRLAAVPVVGVAADTTPAAERPRCTYCGLPHDLTPSMALACASIRAMVDTVAPAVPGSVVPAQPGNDTKTPGADA